MHESDPAIVARAQEGDIDAFRALVEKHSRYLFGVVYRLVRNRGDGLRGVTSDPNRGKHSVTHVTQRERLRRCTLVQCRLETGRTHQIRIHLAAIGHPVVGDPVYGRDHQGPPIECPRTLLHASFLSLSHPVLRQRLSFEDPLPAPEPPVPLLEVRVAVGELRLHEAAASRPASCRATSKPTRERST